MEKLIEHIEPLMAAWSAATRSSGVPEGFEDVNMKILTLYSISSVLPDAPDA